MSDDNARKLFECMETAQKLVSHFQKQHGREPSDAELRVAASLFIENQRASKPNGNGGFQGGGQRNPGSGSSKVAPQDCPKCGGPMWDNTQSKRNPKAPDYRCKNKQFCDGAVWLNSQKQAPQYQDAPSGPSQRSPWEDDSDDLPF